MTPTVCGANLWPCCSPRLIATPLEICGKQNVHSAVQNDPTKLPNVLTANNLYCRSLSRMSTGIKRIQSFQQRLCNDAILSKTQNDWHLYIRTLQTNLNSIQSKVALRVAGLAQRAARSVQMSEITCEAATQNKQAGKKKIQKSNR